MTKKGLTLLPIFAAFSATVLACSCAPPPPPCQAVGQSPLVFLGTVTSLKETPGAFKTASMKVDIAFKGELNTSVDLFDDGMCDGPNLQIGKQYLMYTLGLPSGAVPARGCSRSRAVEDAVEDLAFLKQYATGKVETRITGTVRFRPDEPDDSKLGDAGRTPLRDVLVTMSGESSQLSTKTDPNGRYSFGNLAPGKYSVEASLNGYWLDWSPNGVSLSANGCAVADVLMKVDRRVEGTVRDSEGAAVGGVLVEMASSDSGLEPWQQPVLLDMSDEAGHYSIGGIPPGEYYLGVSIVSTPTKEHPYSRMYYPNTPDPKMAVPIRVPPSASVQELNLQTRPRLPLVKLRGRVLMADGKPPRLQDRPEVRIKEPGLGGQIEQLPIVVDAEGNFTIELCEGTAYSAFAFSGPMRSATYSAPVEFTPRKDNDELVLTIDKTPDEFNKLRKAQ